MMETTPLNDVLPEADFPTVFYMNDEDLRDSLSICCQTPSSIPFREAGDTFAQSMHRYFRVCFTQPYSQKASADVPKSTYDPDWGWIMMMTDKGMPRHKRMYPG
jgi:hypothetical protein